ncbi:MAG: hypothetical protein C0624_06720 [Desulfuromonas sp.]|nr:MAG: hypothetical protein C0624_06720 [Desulfuromonas sp.]
MTPKIVVQTVAPPGINHIQHRRAFAIRYAQLFGLFRREALLLRLRHTGREKVFASSKAFTGPRAQSPSAGILILPFGEHASRLD